MKRELGHRTKTWTCLLLVNTNKGPKTGKKINSKLGDLRHFDGRWKKRDSKRRFDGELVSTLVAVARNDLEICTSRLRCRLSRYFHLQLTHFLLPHSSSWLPHSWRIKKKLLRRNLSTLLIAHLLLISLQIRFSAEANSSRTLFPLHKELQICREFPLK